MRKRETAREGGSWRVEGQEQRSCYADRIGKSRDTRLLHPSFQFALNSNILILHQWLQSIRSSELLKQLCEPLGLRIQGPVHELL